MRATNGRTWDGFRAVGIAAVMAVAWGPPTVSGQQVPPQTYDATVDRFLLTYRDFKGYPDRTAAEVDMRLTDDRRAVLRAVIRAGFISLTPKPGREADIPPGARLVDYLQAVEGIWGVRPGDDEGRRQFRLSLRFKSGIRKVLDAAQEFKGRLSCHVLLPVSRGGDDDPSFPPREFKFARDTSCKWSRHYPKMQVSYSDSDETSGEIDLDFDEGADHMVPSNSDARKHHKRDAAHRHLDSLNRVHNYVSAPLALTCQYNRFHGDNTYGDPRCP